MIIISHQDIGDEFKPKLIHKLLERSFKTYPVFIIENDGFTSVASCHHIIHGSRILFSSLSGHDPSLADLSTKVKNP